MKIHLFTDKQTLHLVESISVHFMRKFEKAHDELKAQLDAETKRQIETNPEVAKIIEDRNAKLEIILKLVELNKQVQEVHKDYSISCNHYNHRIGKFYDDVAAATKAYNEDTNEKATQKAEEFAEQTLGIDSIAYRKECLYNDLKARVAVMGVKEYDDVVAKLESTINISDYFITL